MIAVIGLGPMGRAMTSALLAKGHAVTAWNRTPGKAPAGATVAESAADAVQAADLVLVSLTDHGAMFDALAGARLVSKTVANLGSDTPVRTREAAAWVEARGGRFLAGGVMVPAPVVGTEASFVLYSGSRGVFEAHTEALRAIGDPRYVGEDPGLSQLLYQAYLDVFLTALSGVLHGAALAETGGVRASTFLREARGIVQLVDSILSDPQLASRIEGGGHADALASTRMMGATAAHVLSASQEAGIDLELPRAIESHYARALAAGHANDGWTSLIEILRR